LLGTTREFLDYFSLKKLDDLPTLAQLKELEDLRVQLTLPGADPEVMAATELDPDGLPQGSGDVSAAADDDDERDRSNGQDADHESPRPHGLVARGAQDDAG
jgi:segregation and condensation protein B